MPRAPVSLGPMARYPAPRRPDCELPELLKEVVWTKRESGLDQAPTVPTGLVVARSSMKRCGQPHRPMQAPAEVYRQRTGGSHAGSWIGPQRNDSGA